MVVGLLGLLAGRAHAQLATAQQLFNDAERWMAEGKLDAACDAFEQSNRIDPRAGTLIHLGECREQNRQLAAAAAAYRDALARVKDPGKRAYAQLQLAALEGRLSYLTIVVPDDSRLDRLAISCDGKPLDDARWNHAQPIDGGDHLIVAEADGHETWRTTAHVPVERGQIRVDVPRLAELDRPEPPPPVEAVTPPVAAPVAAAPPAPADPHTASGTPSRFTPRRMIGVGAAVVAAGAVVAGAVLGESAKAKQNDALAQCPDGPACERASAANALIHTGKRQALEANLAFGAAAVAAVAAGALWFTGSPPAEDGSKRVSVLPALAPGQVGLVVAGRL